MGLFSPKNQYAYGGGSTGPNKIIVFAIAGIVGVILIILLIFVINLLNGTGKQDLITASARMNNLQTLTSNASKKLRSADLAKLNSDSSVLLASDKVALTTNLSRVYGVKDIDKDTLAKAMNAADTKALAEAELINKYDITYRQILRKEITSTLVAVRAANNGTSDRQLKTVLQTATTNLNNLDKRLSELNLQ